MNSICRDYLPYKIDFSLISIILFYIHDYIICDLYGKTFLFVEMHQTTNLMTLDQIVFKL
jgi:hypothetical protein